MLNLMTRRRSAPTRIRPHRSVPCATLMLLVVHFGVPGPSVEGQVEARTLSSPEVVSSEAFSDISGLFELRDGRVVIVDQVERSIRILAADGASLSSVGREGAGPGEYLAPTRLFRLTGDSSAVRDVGNSRMIVLAPDGEPVGHLGPNGRLAGAPELSGVPAPEASDAQGNFYARAVPRVVGESGGLVVYEDSVPIVRWTPASEGVDTIAFVPPQPTGEGRRGPGGTIMTTPGSIPPFAPELAWTVSPGGDVAVVHPNPYHVEIIDPTGRRAAGPQMDDGQPLEVTEGHKEGWREARARPRPVNVVSRSGGAAVAVQASPPAEPPVWPSTLPPFLRNGAQFDRAGRLWVERTRPAGDPAVFDVFDSAGNLVEHVTLPPDRFLAGFGRDAIYLVRRDEFDLEHLEVYR